MTYNKDFLNKDLQIFFDKFIQIRTYNPFL